MDQFRDWVLERISKDLLILETPPPKFDPAKFPDLNIDPEAWPAERAAAIAGAAKP